MKTNLKKLLIIPILVIAQQGYANENLNNYKTSCVMHQVYAKASQTLRPVTSDHSMSVSNSSGGAQTYHVQYANYVAYNGSTYSPVAKVEFDVNLETGQTSNMSKTISKNALFSVKGTYPLLCKTIITLNGKEVSSGQGKNYAYIE